LSFFCSKIVDPNTGDEKPIVVSVDDGIRPETSVAGLGKLKTVFKKDGTTTAGIPLEPFRFS
jgi:acetyl-CoA acyltransferase 1